MGGKPSTATPKDKRLAENKPSTGKKPAPFGGNKAPPFSKG